MQKQSRGGGGGMNEDNNNNNMIDAIGIQIQADILVLPALASWLAFCGGAKRRTCAKLVCGGRWCPVQGQTMQQISLRSHPFASRHIFSQRNWYEIVPSPISPSMRISTSLQSTTSLKRRVQKLRE